MRDIGQIRTYVREFLDLEVEDVSDLLIDTWISEGYRKIVRPTKRQKHFEATWTIVTVAGTATYERPESLDEVGSIEGPWGMLEYLDEGAARQRFHRFQAIPQTGWPDAWSEHAGQIKLWPVPDAEHELTITGWRKPANWMAGGAGAVPDFDEDMEDALLAWVMHKAYTHQDDPEMAAAEVQRFAAAIEEALEGANQGPLAAPMVMGGTRRRAGGYVGERPIPWGS